MSNKILFNRGSSLIIPAEWNAGEPFTANTTIEATIALPTTSGMGTQTIYTCQVSLLGERDFEIYAPAQDTTLWATGSGSLKVKRIDANHFPNGDPLVDVIDAVAFEVE